jgi:hypothetical protein
VTEFPTDDPSQAKVVSTPDVSPEIGCHDITIFPDRHLAGAACYYNVPRGVEHLSSFSLFGKEEAAYEIPTAGQ